MKLDPDGVPPEATSLLDLIERWGIGDDYEREAAVEQASSADLWTLVQRVDSAPQAFWQWLGGAESFVPDPSPEYVGLTAVTMAAASARLELRRRER